MKNFKPNVVGKDQFAQTLGFPEGKFPSSSLLEKISAAPMGTTISNPEEGNKVIEVTPMVKHQAMKYSKTSSSPVVYPNK